MNIAIIGAGMVGGALGMLWAQKGHHITFGVRDATNEKIFSLLNSIGQNVQAASIPLAIANAEVIVIAVPATAVEEVVKTRAEWAGKIVIDTTNRFAPTNSSDSVAQDMAGWLPESHIVKAFNSLGANNFASPDFNGIKASMFICGDDSNAKTTVAELINQLGFEVVDVGDLSFAPLLESLAKLWVAMARGGFGRDFAFKILKR